MNRRVAIALSILLIASIVCGGTTPTPTKPSPQSTTVPPVVPTDHNEQVVNGTEGTPPEGIPVDCGTAAFGNVNVPAASFEGTTTIQVDCLSSQEQSRLDQAVENATGQTGELLGAIKLNPSGMTFNRNVIITVPLLRRVDESEGDSVPIYVFQDDSATIYEEFQAPIGADCDRWCATLTTDHFTTFVAYKSGGSASVSCTDPLGCATYASGEAVRIASLLAFSGESKNATVISYDSEAGILAAIEEYGDILGNRIEYKGFDEACNPDQAYESAREIASDPAYAGVIGTVCSSSAEAAMQILSAEGYTMVSASNTGAYLTESNTRPDGYFRVAPSDVYEAQAMAIYAFQNLRIEQVAAVYEDTLGSKQLVEAFTDKFLELGGNVQATDVFNDPERYAELIKARIAAGEIPEAIYMPMPGLGGSFANLVTEYYGDDIVLLGHSSMTYNDDFLERSGLGKFRTYYPLVVPRLLEQAFDYGYDATALLIEAMRKVAQVDADGTLYIGRQALRDALSGATLPGRLGAHFCNSLGDCAAPIVIEVYRYGLPPGEEFSYQFLYETTISP